MKTRLLAAVAASAMFYAAPASAASIITFELQNGALVGAFGNLNPSGAGTDTYQFDLATAGNVFADVGSVGLRLTFTNLDFTSVKLNGTNFDVISSGVFELRSISQLVAAGTQTLSVTYRNAQFLSSYGGKIVVSPVAAVPEPATWAMMMVGFGAIGAAMRYRRRRTAVAFG